MQEREAGAVSTCVGAMNKVSTWRVWCVWVRYMERMVQHWALQCQRNTTCPFITRPTLGQKQTNTIASKLRTLRPETTAQQL